MFAYISGNLVKKSPTVVIIDVNGIGYEIFIPLSTYESLPPQNHQVKLLIFHYVREDVEALYGFSTSDEKKLFQMLIGISGIGPKVAISIMSGTNPEQFRNRIISGDVKALTLIPGIGLKTAKRIIVELREKFIGQDEQIPGMEGQLVLPSSAEEALKALISLGYKRSESMTALRKVLKNIDKGASVEIFIKEALKNM